MMTNINYCTESSFFDTDDLFSMLIDELPTQYENSIDDEILFLPEEEQTPSPSPPSSVQTLTSNLICGVCGAPATGYNFDQVTCESCKAFFRRNALRDTSQLRCRFSGSCAIDIRTRRQCTYCRLKKCFDIKMRKDWIRTEEEKQLRQLQKFAKEQKKSNKEIHQQTFTFPLVIRKKKRLMIRTAIDNGSELVISHFTPNKPLSNDLQIFLNNINNAYKIGSDKADWSHLDRYTSSTRFSQFINDESAMHTSLILFYKSIPQFHQLNLGDQVLLIKNNLVNIIHLHYIIVQNFEDVAKIGEHMSQWVGKEFHQQMADTRHQFYRFSKYPVLLKLTLAVLIFSFNLSLPHGSTKYEDYQQRRQILDCQNLFTTFLWNYLSHLFDEKERVKTIEIIITQILRYQKLMIILDEKLPKSEINHELMQSIFRLC